MRWRSRGGDEGCSSRGSKGKVEDLGVCNNGNGCTVQCNTVTTLCNTVQYSTVQYIVAQHSAVRYVVARPSATQHCQHSTVSTKLYSKIHRSTMQCSALQAITVQLSTIHNSTVQYITVGHSTCCTLKQLWSIMSDMKSHFHGPNRSSLLPSDSTPSMVPDLFLLMLLFPVLCISGV